MGDAILASSAGSGKAARHGAVQQPLSVEHGPGPARGGGAPDRESFDLQANIPGASALPELTFSLGLAFYFGTPDGRVNLEAITPPPLFTVDDRWWFASLASERDPVTNLTLDLSPPYARYASNANQRTAQGNPFAAPLFHDRWYGVECTAR